MANRVGYDPTNYENRENMIIKAGKAGLTERTAMPRRAALGEVGNRLLNQKPADPKDKLALKKDVIAKPFTGIGPPVLQARKPLKEKVGCKKDEIKICEDSLKNKENPPVKEPSNKIGAKKPIVRQESLFKVDAVQSYSTKQLSILDPDEGDKHEPQMVTEYLTDIFDYLREMETKLLIKEKFLSNNHHTTVKMRSILVNWLVEVHINFKGCPETLHLCVAIVDRYLQDHKDVGKETLQLVGTAAMLIACKYEEMYIPDLHDFVYVCDDTFTARQILAMEREILKKLNFDLGRPLSIHFLRRYNKIAKVRAEHHNLGKYVLELALLDYETCYIKPSLQAAAASCLSLAVVNESLNPSRLWNTTLQHYSTYKYTDFKDVMQKFAKLLMTADTSKYKAICKKYAASQFGKISTNYKLQGPVITKLSDELKR